MGGRHNGGRECWEHSCRDLNIGDLLSSTNFEDPKDSLAQFLKKEGITLKVAAQFGGQEIISYDKVLVDEDDLGEDAQRKPSL